MASDCCVKTVGQEFIIPRDHMTNILICRVGSICNDQLSADMSHGNYRTGGLRHLMQFFPGFMARAYDLISNIFRRSRRTRKHQLPHSSCS